MNDIFDDDPQAMEWRCWAAQDPKTAHEAFRKCQKWQNILKSRSGMDEDTEAIEIPNSIQSSTPEVIE
jgi:hypothetical protein